MDPKTTFSNAVNRHLHRPWILSLSLLLGANFCGLTGCASSPAETQPPARTVAAADLEKPSEAVDASSRQDSAAPAEGSSGPTARLADPFQGDGPWALFNGRNLEGWEEADYVGKGEVRVKEGILYLERGYMTGVRWTNDLPRMNYEVTYEAMRVDGTDFFCGFTFPVRESVCTFIAGGWGGGVIGLSSIDGMDAANNETTEYLNFENGRWFKFRVRVTPEKIEAWIDGEPMVEQSIVDRQISVRIEMEACVPLGFATWSTTGAIRNVVLKKI